MELVFDAAYLVAIYAIIILMSRRLRRAVDPKGILSRIRIGFLLLAIGDTGHVGFRVLAYAMGGMNASVAIAGLRLPLVGAGALATAVTVTILYAILLDVCRLRFHGRFTAAWWCLMAVGVARLLIMIPPQNRWGNSVPPFGWSLARNIPLMVLGLGTAILMLIGALREKDRTFLWISILIFLSYAFYAPVILLVQRIPAVGMLMIPKTVMYILMAIVGYRRMFMERGPAVAAPPHPASLS
jgi:hypothetical protein